MPIGSPVVRVFDQDDTVVEPGADLVWSWILPQDREEFGIGFVEDSDLGHNRSPSLMVWGLNRSGAGATKKRAYALAIERGPEGMVWAGAVGWAWRPVGR
jgi:hypothetical protein